MVGKFAERWACWYRIWKGENECEDGEESYCAQQDCHPPRGDGWDWLPKDCSLNWHAEDVPHRNGGFVRRLSIS